MQRTAVLEELTIGLNISVDLPHGCAGYVAVDSLIDNTSSGGVRIVADLSQEEIRALAREMTLKFSFLGLTRGGAKSGIKLRPGLSADERRAVLEAFGRRLGPLVRTGIYYPGMDMNCGPEDLRAIYRGAGIPLKPKVTDTSFFTAVSAGEAMHASRDRLDAGNRPLTVAIEGFGSVGAYLAQRLPADRYRIVAVSTVRGAVHRAEGYSAETLVALRAEHGDALVEHLSAGERIELPRLLTLPVDILVPSARTWAINDANVADITARCIVPVANAPFTAGMVEALHARGVLCLPGFVVNSGGVFASGLSDGGVPTPRIEALAAGSFRAVVAALLQRSAELGWSPVALAEEVAVQRLSDRLTTAETDEERRFRRLRALHRRGMVPKRIFSARWLRHFDGNLKRLQRQVLDHRQ